MSGTVFGQENGVMKRTTLLILALTYAVMGVNADVTTNLWNGSMGGQWTATNA